MPKWLFLLVPLSLLVSPVFGDENLFPISAEIAANSSDAPAFGPFLKITLNVGFVIPSSLFLFKNGDAKMDAFNAKLVGTCKIQAFSGLYDTTGDIEIKVKRMVIVARPTKKGIQLKSCSIEGTNVSMNVRKSIIRNAFLSLITSTVLTDRAISNTVCNQLSGALSKNVNFPTLSSMIGRNGSTDDQQPGHNGGKSNVLNHLFTVGAVFVFAWLIILNIAVGRILYVTLKTER